MSRKSNKQQQGFTIIELLIATTVFSLLLVGILSAFIKISDLFYKGVSMSKTQEDARNIVQSISDDIQFTTLNVDVMQANYSQFVYNGIDQTPYTTKEGAFCVGNHKYSFQIGEQVDGSNYGLGRDTVDAASCDHPTASPSPGVKMLDAGMQLNALSVDCSSGRRCDVKIHVIFYGGVPDDLFTTPCIAGGGDSCNYTTNPWQAPDAQCTGNIESTDLCATVDYDSTVLDNTP